MPKTLVCILDEDLTLNYLFVRELFEAGDSLIVITQQRFAALVERFEKLLPQVGKVQSIVLESDGDEDFWDIICRTVRGALPSEERDYWVNLSGGSRLMSIAVQQVMATQGAKFFFMPHDRNAIIHSKIDDDNEVSDDILCHITHSMSIAEYFKVNGVICNRKEPLLSEEYTQHFFDIFTGNHLSGGDYDTLEHLRDERDRGVQLSDVKGLDKFLNFINFPQGVSGKLTPKEVQYLTGNWFEEYIYHAIKSVFEPDDIAIGVDIQRSGSEQHNDLDVVFTYRNRLYAIECKTGVGKSALYHQIVYKACALKEALLGLRSNSYIFSLNEDHRDRLDQTARNMGITFCGREFAKQPTKLKNLFQNPKMWR